MNNPFIQHNIINVINQKEPQVKKGNFFQHFNSNNNNNLNNNFINPFTSENNNSKNSNMMNVNDKEINKYFQEKINQKKENCSKPVVEIKNKEQLTLNTSNVNNAKNTDFVFKDEFEANKMSSENVIPFARNFKLCDFNQNNKGHIQPNYPKNDTSNVSSKLNNLDKVPSIENNKPYNFEVYNENKYQNSNPTILNNNEYGRNPSIISNKVMFQDNPSKNVSVLSQDSIDGMKRYNQDIEKAERNHNKYQTGKSNSELTKTNNDYNEREISQRNSLLNKKGKHIINLFYLRF